MSECMDCGAAYGGDDWLDLVLPRVQWLDINPDDGGVLCANCIVRRASRLPGAISITATIVVNGLGDGVRANRAFAGVLDKASYPCGSKCPVALGHCGEPLGHFGLHKMGVVRWR